MSDLPKGRFFYAHFEHTKEVILYERKIKNRYFSVKGNAGIAESFSGKIARNVLLSSVKDDGYILSDDNLTAANQSIKRAEQGGLPPSESSVNIVRLIKDLNPEHQKKVRDGKLLIGVFIHDKPESPIREVSVFSHEV